MLNQTGQPKHDKSDPLSSKALNGTVPLLRLSYTKLSAVSSRDMFESIYLDIVEKSNLLQKLTGCVADTIIAGPELVAVIECATAGFAPAGFSDENNVGAGIEYVGVMMNRFRIYSVPSISGFEAYLGTNDIERQEGHVVQEAARRIFQAERAVIIDQQTTMLGVPSTCH